MVGLERGQVALEAYDPHWRECYEREAERLETVFDDRAVTFEHVGSTAVPGLAAKPIIDVLAALEDETEPAALLPVLEANGYEHRPNDGVSDREFLAKGPETNRTHYLSVTLRGSDTHREQVAFRDYLRANATAAAEYESHKRTLGAEHANDRAAYTARKAPLIDDILERALEDRSDPDRR